MQKFKSKIEKFNSKLWTWHFKVPAKVVEAMEFEDAKRVICTLNGTKKFQCAIMPAGNGKWFINVNKKIREILDLDIDALLSVELEEDRSEYGLPMPAELDALLKSDPEGAEEFEKLTSGKQRTLLYMIDSKKVEEVRIKRAIAIVEHLKMNKGKIDYRQLNEMFKNS